jgi:hypothetical protein
VDVGAINALLNIVLENTDYYVLIVINIGQAAFSNISSHNLVDLSRQQY